MKLKYLVTYSMALRKTEQCGMSPPPYGVTVMVHKNDSQNYVSASTVKKLKYNKRAFYV